MDSFPIYVLWVVPILAFGVFLFLVAWFAEKRSAHGEKGPAAAREPSVVEDEARSPSPESRIGEIEGRLGSLTSQLEGQREDVARFQRESLGYQAEVSRLRTQLESLQDEYDLVSSENYTLRAQIKQLQSRLASQRKGPGPSSDEPEVDRKMYDDTRLMRESAVRDAAGRDQQD